MLLQRLAFIFFLLQTLHIEAQQVRIALQNCKLNEETLIDIRHSLTFQSEFYADIFNDNTIRNVKARIFGSKKEFLEYAKTKAGFKASRTHTIAFYSYTLKEMILHTEVDDFPRTFAHELSHAILHARCPEHDDWLSEGLAEFFEDVIADDTTYRFNFSQINKFRDTAAFFRAGADIGETVHTANFYGSDSDKHYTFSWAIVLYLYQLNPELLKKIIVENCKGVPDTLDLNYPGRLDLLHIDIKSYFLNARFDQG
jgi:hypothetical protein